MTVPFKGHLLYMVTWSAKFLSLQLGFVDISQSVSPSKKPKKHGIFPKFLRTRVRRYREKVKFKRTKGKQSKDHSQKIIPLSSLNLSKDSAQVMVSYLILQLLELTIKA